MREEIRKIQDMMEAAEYVTDAPVATSIHLAMRLRKPLLIEGPAGVGMDRIEDAISESLFLRHADYQSVTGCFG